MLYLSTLELAFSPLVNITHAQSFIQSRYSLVMPAASQFFHSPCLDVVFLLSRRPKSSSDGKRRAKAGKQTHEIRFLLLDNIARSAFSFLVSLKIEGKSGFFRSVLPVLQKTNIMVRTVPYVALSLWASRAGGSV
jgi:hypothetical protein